MELPEYLEQRLELAADSRASGTYFDTVGQKRVSAVDEGAHMLDGWMIRKNKQQADEFQIAKHAERDQALASAIRKERGLDHEPTVAELLARATPAELDEVEKLVARAIGKRVEEIVGKAVCSTFSPVDANDYEGSACVNCGAMASSHGRTLDAGRFSNPTPGKLKRPMVPMTHSGNVHPALLGDADPATPPAAS